MALCRFSYLRNPDYNQGVLLAQLTEYFGKLSRELNIFFDLHYHNLLELKALTKETNQ